MTRNKRKDEGNGLSESDLSKTLIPEHALRPEHQTPKNRLVLASR